MHEKYAYPDTEDQCIHNFIGTSYGQEKWAEEEQWVLNRTLEFFQTRLKDKDALMIDVGCGEGRLVPIFAPFFKHIICIEPDRARLASTRKLVVDHKITNVSFLNGYVPSLQIAEKADFILCSHIIQHIPTNMLQPFILWISDHLKLGASMLMLFAKSTSSKSTFTIVTMNGNTSFVNETKFNQVYSKTGSLPVHHIPPSKVEKLLLDVNMHIYEEYSYHLGGRIPKLLVGAALRFFSNAKTLARRIGIDHGMLVIKR